MKTIDDQMKTAFGLVNEALHLRKNVEKVIIELCDECSCDISSNMAACLRIIILRLASCPTVVSCKIIDTDLNYPHLAISGELTPKLNRTLSTLNKALSDFHW